MLTPQSTTTLSEIAARLNQVDSIAICGHVNPDGDCIGAGLALYHALKGLGKEVTVLLAKPDPVPHNLLFLPGVEQFVPAHGHERRYDCFIAVDVPTQERLGDAASIQEAATTTITIDHHACDFAMSQYNYVDPDAPAASLIVWDLLKTMEALNSKSALCSLTGVMTDTGRFAYQNTTPESFSAAAEMMELGADPALISREFFQNRRLASMELEKVMLDRMVFLHQGAFVASYLMLDDFERFGALKADSEVLVDELRSIEGVQIALLLRESEENTVRGSLRAKDKADVAQVARVFDGGGHTAAAGFTYHGSIFEALDEVSAQVNALCFDGDEVIDAHKSSRKRNEQ